MHKPWHLLVYIAADNSLYNDALVSLRQITEASLLSSVKITVQFDGPTDDSSVRYSCEGGKRRVIWSAPQHYALNRADRLRRFLDEVPQDPDNERTFLILWGHEAGLDHVYLYNDRGDPMPTHAAHVASQDGTMYPAQDDAPAKAQHAIAQHVATHHHAVSQSSTSPQAAGAAKLQVPGSIPFDLLNPDNANANRYLKDIELGSILADYSREKLKRPIEILGFDACLMGLAEICHEVAQSVRLIVASDEELPKGSWPYDSILQDLTQFPGMDSSSLSAVIVSRFMERYLKESRRTRISLSAYRLEASEELARAVRGFVEEVSTNIDNETLRTRVILARDFSRTLEVPDYIDLGVFCNEIIQSFSSGETIRHRAEEIRKILVETPYILYHRDAGQRGLVVPTGLAIYFPQVMPPSEFEVDTALKAVQHLRSYSPLARTAPPRPPTQSGKFNPQNGNEPLPENGMKTTSSDHTKSMLRFGKTVNADSNKTPPGDRQKSVDGVRVVERQLIGSEILWNDYAGLRFNGDTGWAKMVENLITYVPKSASATVQDFTDQTTN